MAVLNTVIETFGSIRGEKSVACCILGGHWLLKKYFATGRYYYSYYYLRLDGPGMEFPWARDFPCRPRPAPRPTQPFANGNRVFPGAKAAGAWC